MDLGVPAKEPAVNLKKLRTYPLSVDVLDLSCLARPPGGDLVMLSIEAAVRMAGRKMMEPVTQSMIEKLEADRMERHTLGERWDREKEELLTSLKENGLPLLPCKSGRSVTINKRQWTFVSDWRLAPWILVNQYVGKIIVALERVVDFDHPLPEGSPLWDYMRFEPFKAETAKRTSKVAYNLHCFFRACVCPRICRERRWDRRRCAIFALHGLKPCTPRHPCALELEELARREARVGHLDGHLWRRIVSYL
eukprot:gnl/MRDRNA2_/MRDRNA2_145069_c0_seq1.p1 gnl/MRDRNA2_/MRDRNA2_145069_c0~~gnl/MRDRNA2_/MRDRNA2_145069_c0_seq1.p1  ORF type:complete len:251 (+),score=39.32 gnl/MRDRNA2_/MRDRNA2_145069_c0_seq1:163-915(+)